MTIKLFDIVENTKKMRVSVYRKAHFNAAHRLHNPNWSKEKNESFYGLCNSPNFHGHNYDMEVRVTGEMNQETGYLIDLKELSTIIKTEVEDRFDHKNLNLDTEEFKDIIPSTENLCFVIWKILTEALGEKLEVRVKLWETPRNAVAYPAT